MPEPCPTQLQPSPVGTPTLTPPQVKALAKAPPPPHLRPAPAPYIQSPGKCPHPELPKSPTHAPTRRVSHLGPAGGVCGGGGRLGRLMLKGANCHQESGRPHDCRHTRPSHSKSHKLTCYNAPTAAPSAKAHVMNGHRHTKWTPFTHPCRIHAYSFSESTPTWDPAESNTTILSDNNHNMGLYNL